MQMPVAFGSDLNRIALRTPPVMRRVYLISTAFQEDYEVGFANGLLRNGIPVTVIGSRRTATSRLDRGVHFLDLRGDQDPGRRRIVKIANILRYFGALARRAAGDRSAIFHTNGIFALRRGWGVLLEALWCRLICREWWLTVHNLLPHDEETWTNRLVFGIAYKLPNRLFVHTEATARELCARFRIDRERVRIIEHGIDRFVEPDPSSKAYVQRQFSLPAFNTLILLFGNISRYKGVDLLLDAVDQATLPSDVIVLIAGRSSSDAYRKELVDKLTSMKSRRQVVWKDDYIPDSDLPHLLAAADCMVLPYRKIDQSGVMFAAKSAGTPVIVSDVGSFQAYMDPECDLLVPAEDVSALAGALTRVVGRGPITTRETYTAAARKKYAWEVTLRPYAELVKTS
jgi:glycosyltransferase involved in cell wall biosynthesis